MKRSRCVKQKGILLCILAQEEQFWLQQVMSCLSAVIAFQLTWSSMSTTDNRCPTYDPKSAVNFTKH